MRKLCIIILIVLLTTILLFAEARWQRKKSLQTNSRKVLATMVVDLESDCEDLTKDIIKKDDKIDRLKVRARFGTTIIVMIVLMIVLVVGGITVYIVVKVMK